MAPSFCDKGWGQTKNEREKIYQVLFKNQEISELIYYLQEVQTVHFESCLASNSSFDFHASSRVIVLTSPRQIAGSGIVFSLSILNAKDGISNPSEVITNLFLAIKHESFPISFIPKAPLNCKSRLWICFACSRIFSNSDFSS